MKQLKWMIIFLPFLMLAGCVSVCKTSVYSDGSVELARVENEKGVDIYELKRTGSKMNMTLVVRSERNSDRRDLGLTLNEVTKDLGQTKMLSPYRGLYVKEVKDGGAAARAGILPGDILTMVNGIEIMYLDQYNYILKNATAPESEVELVLLRGFENKEELVLKVVPDSIKVTIPSTPAIRLEPPGIEGPSYAGIVIGTLPAEWTQKIYGEDRSTVLISGVVIGSPAYLGGLRSGDRILSVNGAHFETATELKEWIMEHGPQGETVLFEVFQRQGGKFSAEVDLEEYDGSTDMDIPFLFELDHDAIETEWDFGPFGWIVEYDGRYCRSKSRDANYRRRVSCIIGLFKYRWGPDYGRVRLLWFLTFGSD